MATDEFRRLLERRMAADTSESRAEVDAAIRTRYERDRAVLITDMTGFSRITQEEGILHFLELIHRMHRTTLPIIEALGGRLVKAEADNVYAMFDGAQAAVNTAIALQEACRRDYGGKRDNDTVALSIGVAWGRVLDLDGREFFGDPVNVASKLGEDIGGAGDVLLTRAVADRIETPAGWSGHSRTEHISGIDIELVSLTRV